MSEISKINKTCSPKVLKCFFMNLENNFIKKFFKIIFLSSYNYKIVLIYTILYNIMTKIKKKEKLKIIHYKII